MIPEITAKGFIGLMLDTLDTPPYLESLSAEQYGGMKQAAVSLVHDIRAAHPDLMLIVNRGYALLPQILDCVDLVIAESLLASPTGRNDIKLVMQQLRLLRQIRKPILSLDYWSPDDPMGIAALYAEERSLGHHPYVTTMLLDRIVPEPTGVRVAAAPPA